jgi:hypothetical protein
MGAAAAIAGVGAVASIGGSLISSSAAKSAANTQANAANQAAAMQQQEQAQVRSDLSPYRDAGNTATGTLLSTLGLSGGNGQNLLAQNGLSGLTFNPTQAALEATPGYQFNLAQGQNAVAASNAAQGRGISGAALKGAANFATGLASNTLGQQQQIYQQNVSNVMNPLQSLAGSGQNAAVQTGQMGTQGALSAGQATVGAGNAQASGTIGSANSLTGAINSFPANYSMYKSLLGGGNTTGPNASYTGDTGNYG